MTRIAAVQVAGYFPTQPVVLPHIAGLLARPPGPHSDLICDPCAGEGEAVAYLVGELYDADSRTRVHVHLAEMESTRAKTAERNVRALGVPWGNTTVHNGDALRLDVGRFPASTYAAESGISLLYLNPPYDTDSRFRRLEARFLAKFAPAMAADGVLLFIVPVHALTHCADLLARCFTAVDILRFPDPVFAEFRQVVVRATKLDVDLLAPHPGVAAQVRAAATPEGCAALRVLGQPIEPVELPVTPPRKKAWHATGEDPYEPGVAAMMWKERAVDLDAVRVGFRPWGAERAAGITPGVFPIFDAHNPGSTRRRFSAAIPLKPAHIAAAIAAGTFNGAALLPADASAGHRPLMVKGVFSRQWRTVDERENAQGEPTVDVQVEEPLLEVTALDLSTLTMHRLEPSPNVTGTTDPATMSTGDLLVAYTPALLRTLHEQCPVSYDPEAPGARYPIAETGRPLYPAQADSVRALLALLGGPVGVPKSRREGTFAFLIGEVGCGKSGTFLVTARNAGAHTVLIVCPPHLGDGWTDEVRVVWPEATVLIVDSTSVLDALAARRAAGDRAPVVAILTRETGKLGHAWEGVPATPCACARGGAPRRRCVRCKGTGMVAAVCPRCGIPAPAIDLAARRARCEGGTLTATSYVSAVGLTALTHLRGHADIQTAHLTPLSRTHATPQAGIAAALSVVLDALPGAPNAERISALMLLSAAANALALATGDYAQMVRTAHALLKACAHPEVSQPTAEVSSDSDPEEGPRAEAPREVRYTAAKLLAAAPGQTPGWEAACGELASGDHLLAERARARSAHLYDGAEDRFEWHLTDVRRDVPPARDGAAPRTEEVTTIGSQTVGDIAVANSALSYLLAGVSRAKCGEPLFGAVPKPRRVPLASYILRKHRHLFDFLGLDEAHEYGTDGSAQERAAHRLTALRVPTVLLTGSFVNGYAHHMYATLWALSRQFRALFGRGDRERFAQRYGYRKRIVPAGTSGVQTFGAVTDRVETQGPEGKDAGAAPGVQPIAILEWLLPYAVTLHKRELRIAIPDFSEERVGVAASEEQLALHTPMLSALVAQVKRDLFTPLSGALWGALSEAPSHLDRMCADAGNTPGGAWEVRYPPNRELPLGVDRVIHTSSPLPAATVLPKEQAMLDRLEAELAEGRSVIILPYHTDLYTRLARLARARTGLPVSILDPNKVSSQKRQAWITGELKRGCRILVTGPTPISTGLNVLTAFSTVLWMENPACNAITKRQVEGRIDRIGQKLPSRSVFFVYENTVQTAMHTLLMQKVAVSQSTDGLDARSALQAAGVGESGGLSALGMGRLLFDILDGRRTL